MMKSYNKKLPSPINCASIDDKKIKFNLNLQLQKPYTYFPRSSSWASEANRYSAQWLL